MIEYQSSKYLQVLQRENDYAVYHSLFGKLCLVDKQGIDILNEFSTAKPILCEENRKENFLRQMVERGFVQPANYDEYTLIENHKKNRMENLSTGFLVRALQLVVSNKCNFKCKYCFVGSMYNSKERKLFENNESNMQMSEETAVKSMLTLIDIVKRNNNNNLSVEFFGGEPLMNWKVISRVLEKFGDGKSNGINLYYSITTNGSLITNAIADMFKKMNVTVAVSFDSPKNCDRLLANGKNASLVINKGVEKLKSSGCWTTFNSVLSKETVRDFDYKSLVDAACYYNVAMIGLILDLDLGFYGNPENRAEAIEKIVSTYIYGKRLNVPIVGYWHQIFSQLIGKQPLNLQKGYKTCPAEGCKLSIEPAGHAFICKCCSAHIGHISNLDIVLSSEHYRKYCFKAYENASECYGCKLQGFCSGVCMGALEKKYSDIYVVEQSSCDLFRDLMDKLIENIATDDVDSFYFL